MPPKKPTITLAGPNGGPGGDDERAPLIAGQDGAVRQGEDGDGQQHGGTVRERLGGLFAYHEGEPSFGKSMRNLFFSSWLNLVLVAVPLSFASHFAGWGATADFVISFLAIIPLAGLLGDATEQVALKVGQTVGGLLNATFGNAVEAIVGVIALTQGQLRIVQTSMLGSILSNILLVLGCAFVGAGIRFKESHFQATAAQASASLMTLACVGLVIPAAYHAGRRDDELNNLFLDRGAAVASVAQKSGNGGWVETLLQEAPGAGDDDGAKGVLIISRGTAIVLFLMYCLYLFFQLYSHAYLFEEESDDSEEEEAKMGLWSALVALLGVTVVTAFCADYLVGSIDEFASNAGIPKPFIGLILLPIVGNAAEHVTSVWMAAKGKMELAIGVAVGSSIQIAVGVIPLLVLVGWAIGRDLTLFFQDFETIVLVFSVLLVTLLILDGKSNFMEGSMLIGLYLIICIATWVE